jgi:hypothetical protein
MAVPAADIRLHHTGAEAPAFAAPNLVEEHHAGAPFAAHPDAGDEAEGEQRKKIPGEGGEDRSGGEQRQTRDQCVLAADLIAEPADGDAADHRAGERHRNDQAGLRQRHAERFLNLRQQKRHDDQIVEIEGVAEDRRPSDETALAAGVSQIRGGQSASPPIFGEV